VDRFQYTQIRQYRDPQKSDDPKVYVCGPEDDAYRHLEVPGADGKHLLELFNRMGADGWELLGPPSRKNVAVTYKNDAGHWMDTADWSDQIFWFKRVSP
jgi:hypothetical protein